MVYIRPADVTVPVRFIVKTMHFVSVLTIAFDLDKVVSEMTMINPSTTTDQTLLDDFDEKKATLSGLVYAAFACFAVEYIALFLGISIFFQGVTSLNILAHFVGLILTVLFYTDGWSLDSFIGFFTVFNALPMVLEVLTFAFITRFSFTRY